MTQLLPFVLVCCCFSFDVIFIVKRFSWVVILSAFVGVTESYFPSIIIRKPKTKRPVHKGVIFYPDQGNITRIDSQPCRYGSCEQSRSLLKKKNVIHTQHIKGKREKETKKPNTKRPRPSPANLTSGGGGVYKEEEGQNNFYFRRPLFGGSQPARTSPSKQKRKKNPSKKK